MKQLTQKLNTFFSSSLFFKIIIGFFLFEALWFVFSAIYPMAFDEDFHFGLIQLYSHHWTPFLSGQPEGADKFGAVAHDPSFLYHYAMSFPYRIVSLFTNNETAQVITLRLMNVAMFTWGLFLYRKVMLRAKASRALTNVTLAIFSLIPIVPFLAAHINYDNIFVVLVPLICLAGFDLIEGFKKKQINLKAFIVFVILCMITTLVKYAALPIALAAVIGLAFVFWRSFKGDFKAVWPGVTKAYGKLTAAAKYTLLGFFLLFGVFFVQRYGVNMVQYHNPVPDCGEVLTVKQCSAYGPWNRDHNYTAGKNPNFHADVVKFTGTWFRGMWHRCFFAINGAKSWYMNYRELPVPSQTAVVLAVVGLLSMVIWWRAIFRGNALLAFAVGIALFYIFVVWFNGFTDYKRIGVAVAINGRYLLPVLPLLAIAMGKGIALTLQKFKHVELKPHLAALTILLFLHGGGVFTFMLRSDDSWYWPNSFVKTINHAAQDVVSPITYKGLKQ